MYKKAQLEAALNEIIELDEDRRDRGESPSYYWALSICAEIARKALNRES